MPTVTLSSAQTWYAYLNIWRTDGGGYLAEVPPLSSVASFGTGTEKDVLSLGQSAFLASNRNQTWFPSARVELDVYVDAGQDLLLQTWPDAMHFSGASSVPGVATFLPLAFIKLFDNGWNLLFSRYVRVATNGSFMVTYDPNNGDFSGVGIVRHVQYGLAYGGQDENGTDMTAITGSSLSNISRLDLGPPGHVFWCFSVCARVLSRRGSEDVYVRITDLQPGDLVVTKKGTEAVRQVRTGFFTVETDAGGERTPHALYEYEDRGEGALIVTGFHQIARDGDIPDLVQAWKDSRAKLRETSSASQLVAHVALHTEDRETLIMVSGYWAEPLWA